MLSIGWPEMMIVAAAALIIVGPRDLPALLRNVGRMAGQVRRMGNDFRRELNKVAAVDEVRDIKKSISQPLTDSRRQIESEFNKITPHGVEPSGALKPADPNAESVYDEIKAATADVKQLPDPEAARASMAEAVKKGQANAAERKAAAQTGIPARPDKPAKAAPKRAPSTKTGAGNKAATAGKRAKSGGASAKDRSDKSAAAATGTAKTATKSGTNKAGGSRSATSKTAGKAARPATRKAAAGAKRSSRPSAASTADKG